MKLTTILAAAVLSAGLAFAQGRGPRNGGNPPDPQTMIQQRVSMLASELGLSDDQKTKATTIFTAAGDAAQNPRTALRTTAQSMTDAIKKNDTAGIDQLSANIGTLQGQLGAIQAKAEAAFYAILTPDQQSKYRVAPFGGPGGMGAGMMGRGPGFGRNRPPQ